MRANISTLVFNRKDCYYDGERNLLAIAQFLARYVISAKLYLIH